DNGGSRQGLRPRDVGAKPAVPAFDGDAILHHYALLRHCVLLRRHSSVPPPMSSKTAEAHYRASRVQPAGTLWLTKRHSTLLPRLPERLLPLFGSHRARVAAATA